MSREQVGSRLSAGNFLRGDLAGFEKAALIEDFGSQGLITEVIGVIDDGKEATVYCCRAAPGAGPKLLAAKVYRAQKFRSFSNTGRYESGRFKAGSREERAILRSTRKGRRMAHHAWIDWEWETLCRLSDAGADVPFPLACSADAILMQFVGDGETPAPQLRQVALEPATANRVFEVLMRDLEILLDCHLIHGDLSAYNVLWAQGRPWIIDLPQAIDARKHPEAQRYLGRDVENLCEYFEPYGLGRDPGRISADLWQRYVEGQLGR